jgi:hypothetical protein
MSERVGELSLGRKRRLKRPNLADAIDTPRESFEKQLAQMVQPAKIHKEPEVFTTL